MLPDVKFPSSIDCLVLLTCISGSMGDSWSSVTGETKVELSALSLCVWSFNAYAFLLAPNGSS